MSTDTTTPQEPAAGDVPDVVLDAHLRSLRDHLLGTFGDLEPSGHRGELTLVVPADQIGQVLAFAKTDPALACEMLADVSAVHWPAMEQDRNTQETTGWPTYTDVREEGVIEVDYILRSVSLGHWFRLRVNLPDTAPQVASATAHYSSANFMEREVYDLMGVDFVGHPNLTRIMMPDDWDGHPHRKDYPLGGVEVMYKGTTVPPPDEREY